MSARFIPAQPGCIAIFVKADGGLVRRAVIAWKILDGFNARALPVTMADGERVPLPDAVLFPDGHVEATDGVRAWLDTEGLRKDIGAGVFHDQ